MAIFAWLVIWSVVMSFVEWGAHRYTMHRKSPLHRWFPGVYERHAVGHHRTFYHQFDREPDPDGQWLNIHFGVNPSLPIAAPILVALWLISPASSVTLAIVVSAHHLTWNLIHEEMHIPSGRWFARTAVYRFLARHHYLHHRYPGKCYNVTLPIADLVLGTWMFPRPRDVAAMEAIGL